MRWSNLYKPKHSGGLGFRDFKIFNEAILAKQVWRLMHREDSMLYRCLKARYFPKHSILEAPVGFRPSYAWRSICAARHVIMDGSRWRVGNGKSIKIWEDAWIPGQGSGMVLSPIKMFPSDAKVEDLIIDVEARSWDKSLVEGIFHHAEASKILRIL
ncbi:uncharacterized mitochondrial protein AtMg00310-like [Lotus japonicus]|uniref:uncharacterized mitochondrial protein AtMg00310-like n=1 Tax=Lotus japonicus TaxID=34305 RepID=UPI00258F5AC2|nr:uncharacterized mitochondrial protein AtMg00310-like [Lotus japonicus]